MALAAITVAQRGERPAPGVRFGYHRTEVIAAGLNGLVLLGLPVWVAYNAIRRFGDSPQLEGGLILLAGGIGLVVNVIGLLLLRGGRRRASTCAAPTSRCSVTRSARSRC